MFPAQDSDTNDESLNTRTKVCHVLCL